MIQLQYRNPVNGKCTCRYFKTYDGMYRHIKKFNTYMNYFYIDDEDDDPDFHYEVYLPEDFVELYLPDDFCWIRFGDEENV